MANDTRKLTKVSSASLDEMIRLAELDLIAREERLWRGAATLKVSVKQRLNPRRLLVPGLVLAGAVTATVAGWRLWRRRSHRHSPVPMQRMPEPSSLRPKYLPAMAYAVPWASVVNLVWPLLPAAWRRHAAPGAVADGLALTAPWAARWLARRG